MKNDFKSLERIRFINNNFDMTSNFFGLQLANSLTNICGNVTEHLKMGKLTASAQNESDSQSFYPEYHQIKKLGIKVNRKKIRTGGWSSRENQVYLQFMMQNQQDFLSEKSRRKTKVFYRLSKILKRRTPDQCRSHHQKLQLKYRDDLRSIINEVQRKIHTCAIQEYMTDQQRLHQYGLEMVRKSLRLNQVQNGYKTIISCNWYNIKSYGSSFKLSVDCNTIKQW